METFDPDAFRPVNNTVRVILKGTVNNNMLVNTFYFRYRAGFTPTATELTNLCDDFASQIVPIYRSLVTPVVRWNEITAQDIHAQFGTQISRPITVDNVGIGTGDTSPGNVSVGLRRRTSFPGKSGRGRIMLPPPPESTTQGDQLAHQQHIANLFLLVYRLSQAHPHRAGEVFRPAVASYRQFVSRAITSWVFDTILDSMRTRLTGRGT